MKQKRKEKKMAHSDDNKQAGIELFRYIELKKPQIIDIWYRINKIEKFPDIDLLKKEKDEWAKKFLSEHESPAGLDALEFTYLDYLNIEELPLKGLPTGKDLKDIASFKSLNIYSDSKYQNDYVNLLAFMMAYQIQNDSKKLQDISKLFAFIDKFPKLHQVQNVLTYPTPIFKKLQFKTPKTAAKKQVALNADTKIDVSKNEEMRTIVDDILLLWQLKNEIKQKQQKDYEAERKEIKRQYFEKIDKMKPAMNPEGEEKQSKISKKDAKIQKQYSEVVKERKIKLSKLQEEKNNLDNMLTLSNMMTTDFQKLIPATNLITKSQIENTQIRLKNFLMTNMYVSSNQKFCQIYKEVANKVDKLSSTPPLLNCVLKDPKIVFENQIRLMGWANLIKVEETLIRYKPGEISHIQNIMPHESLSHEVKNTNYYEDKYDIAEEESTEESQKIGTTTNQELSSEINNEINSRFNSDVNASANASGGGSIGVADISGGATLQAALGIGTDSSSSNANTSQFSQEIINEAVKNTKKSVHESRMKRSYTMTETTDLHEFDNSDNDEPVNGIYVFLDKEICIKETQYGKRLFMLANVMLPGNSLLCKKNLQEQMKLSELGPKPVFNLSPTEIQPDNYQEWVALYRASGIQTPPSAVKTIVRTYKTDTTNANVEQQEFNVKKVADVLVPFFERYKRFLITDTVTIPDGYQVQEVVATVNHGQNGISIPAHLPLSLAGASMYAAPNLLAAVPYAGLTLPIAFWQIAYLASPLLHYNTDSSNVTVSIGNESYDSNYFFFQAEELIQMIFSLLGGMGSLLNGNNNIIDQINEKVNDLITDLGDNANNTAADLAAKISTSVDTVIGKIKYILNLINEILSGKVDKLGDLFDAISALTINISLDLSDLIGTDFFEPFRTFIQGVLGLITDGFSDIAGEFFDLFINTLENTQNFPFPSLTGWQGELPVSLNTISIHPGVTVNLSVCAIRTEEALEQWRLDTFSKLYQAYLEQVVEYENKKFALTGEESKRTSPANMRQEERAVVKDLVLEALNNYHEENGDRFDLDRINFFENVIDWQNMSYRLYTYGPNANEVRLEKNGFYHNIDDKREAFLKAHWAQVLIPVDEDPANLLEAKMMQYFQDGSFDFEDGFEEDELTALYQDLILGREELQENPGILRECKVTLPTDLVTIWTQEEMELPEYSDNDCSECD